MEWTAQDKVELAGMAVMIAVVLVTAASMAYATHIPWECDRYGHCSPAVPEGAADDVPADTIVNAACPEGHYPYRGVDHLTCIPFGGIAAEASNGVCWMHVPEPARPEPAPQPEPEPPRRTSKTAYEPPDAGVFDRPRGVAANGTHVFVADTSNHRIQIIQVYVPAPANGTAPPPARVSFGEPGTGPGEFDKPFSVALDDAGRIFVTDYGNARIQVFDASGNHMFTFGAPGTGPGRFSLPGGIAVADGTVFVADAGNHRVQMFDLNGTYAGTVRP